MFFQLKRYFLFLKKSTNQHGVHSPFVYNLITKCFYDKTNFDNYSLIKKYKLKLLQNKNTIEVTGLGVDSKTMRTTNPVISTIAKANCMTNFRVKLLYRIINYLKPKSVLELGNSLGFSAYAMALANKESKIISIEGSPNISEFTKENLSSLNTENVTIKTGNFKEIIPVIQQQNFDFIFFDGNHSKETILNYFELLLPKVHNDSVFIFNTINCSKSIAEAWEMIKQHPKVTVTIDTFLWGFVFFRKEQEKEHFTIRV